MENIAIIGIANLFPGSNSPDDFWQGLLNKKDNRKIATNEQMGLDPKKYLGKKGETDKYYCLHGGYIEKYKFNIDKFNINAKYLSQLDDLHHFSLFVAKKALQNAGKIDSTELSRCGTILGNLSFPTKSSNQIFIPLYNEIIEKALQSTIHSNFKMKRFTSENKIHYDNALLSGYPSTLINMALGLGAQHFSLDAACASSCYAIKIACDFLFTRKADLMLAGAVSAADPMFVNMGFSIFQAYPENQIHAPFDQKSQGLFAGEGAGMIVLKRQNDAVRDNDNILAIIKGGALSNDGRGKFILSPNSKGQVLVYNRAYKNAKIKPTDIDYIECHATGTPKGDSVELNSMQKFFSPFGHKPLIGSVKSNLGHLLTAAGMPGTLKAIWALNNKIIPATINLNKPIVDEANYFNINHMPVNNVKWPTSNSPETAGVSVFGFGGANAHIVLQNSNKHQQIITNNKCESNAIHIIGMDAHFGDADTITSLKKIINNNQTLIRKIPKNRNKLINDNVKIQKHFNITKLPVGGFIEKFEMDFLRFKIPANDTDYLIPQQLLMMKVADNAAQMANLKEGANVGVLVAMGTELELHRYRGRVNLHTQIANSLNSQGLSLSNVELVELENIAKNAIAQEAKLNQYTSFIGNIMASRISALWNFSGPAMTISSEENSAFRCIELADTLFKTSDIEAIIVAAVDLAGSIENICLRSLHGPMSNTKNYHNVFKSGFQIGDGAAAIVLITENKKKQNVLNSYGKIESISFIHNTNTQSLNNACKDALIKSKIQANKIDLIEAHSSGFDNENSIEISSLQKIYPNTKIDSIKRYIGHTFNAHGLAGIIHAIFQFDINNYNYIGINGLGRDQTSCHLIISKTKKKIQKNKIHIKANKSLIKTIQMGGTSIVKQIKKYQNLNILNKFKILKKLPITHNTNRILSFKMMSYQEPNMAVQIKELNYQQSLLKSSKSIMNNDKKISMLDLKSHITKTHTAFLKARKIAQLHISNKIKYQIANKIDKHHTYLNNKNNNFNSITSAKKNTTNMDNKINYPSLKLIKKYNPIKNIIFNTSDIIEFAEGNIGKVFGTQYNIIDTYKRRVRLPTTDYLLVTRVTDLKAKTNEYKKSYMATEYDIPINAPYLIDGQIPWSVSVESGQCDLMLISYIGIDFISKGERVYRLLDCELTFLYDMAFGGETLRYEIHIDNYAKNGDQLLFFFHYDCYVNNKKVLIMRNGCAGFFTDEELADGKGVLLSENDKKQLNNAKKSKFIPLIYNKKNQFNYHDIMKLVNGDISGCLGPQYNQNGRNPSLKFSSKKFLMIERITKIKPHDGHWGLGILEGQKDIEPNHWYFPCHFKDDQVMAGSLMSEGCGQLAMFYMMWLGMHNGVNNARFQPIPKEPQTVRCRGQVRPQSNTLTYRMEVTEIGMSPHPYIKANIDIILDNKVVVDFKNLSVMMKEQNEESPYPVKLPQFIINNINKEKANINEFNKNVKETDETGKIPFLNEKHPLMWIESNFNTEKIKGVTPIKHIAAPIIKNQNIEPNKTPFTPWHMFEFATGNISKCFGEDFDVYKNRIPPRTPCGDLQLVTQVTHVDGNPMKLNKPSHCIAEYYVPNDAWYFTKNSINNWMPYSIIMEIALQPNGFLSGYMKTTLKYPQKDLFFRNLDGKGKLIKQIDLRGKTIINNSKLISTSIAGGAIIQSFTFNLSINKESFYTGSAVFGYFSEESLSNQLGIDNGKLSYPWFQISNIENKKIFKIDLCDKENKIYKNIINKPHYRLAGGQLNFLDNVSIVEKGGKYNAGYISGEKIIDATDWFFRYHFHQDPVMPGSLGVEAIIELLQIYIIKNDLGLKFKNPRFITPLTEVIWKYRGQITPMNNKMSLDIHIKKIIEQDSEIRIVGDANLSKDNLRIYQITNITLSIVEA